MIIDALWGINDWENRKDYRNAILTCTWSIGVLEQWSDEWLI